MKPQCILCGTEIFGKPAEMTEGLMCPDGNGCRRRALADTQCRATIGVRNDQRCEKRAGHVNSEDAKDRRHRADNTEWNDTVPVTT